MNTQLSTENLSVILHNNTPVITTDLLAKLYGAEINNIQVNFSRNADRFISGKHYFKVEGTELKELKYQLTLSKSVKIARNASSLILWTERGAARHAKMLETDQAWEVFEKLEDCYFSNHNKDKEALFNGKILLTIQDGNITNADKLGDDCHVANLDSFFHIAKKAGFIVINPDELIKKLNS